MLVSYFVEVYEPPPAVRAEPENAALIEASPPTEAVEATSTVFPSPVITDTFTLFAVDGVFYLVVLATILAICIGTLIICLALKQSSSNLAGGFSSHLPQGTPQQAFSPVSSPQGIQTPIHHRTPTFPGRSGGGSAFRQPPSPQHGLFSQ